MGCLEINNYYKSQDHENTVFENVLKKIRFSDSQLFIWPFLLRIQISLNG